jgi:hypothetical protein
MTTAENQLLAGGTDERKSHVVRVAGKCAKSDIVRLCFYRPFPVIVHPETVDEGWMRTMADGSGPRHCG